MILSMALDVAQGMNWLHLSKPPRINLIYTRKSINKSQNDPGVLKL
jgi:hypothetical protein